MRTRSRRAFLALSGTGLAAAVLAALGGTQGDDGTLVADMTAEPPPPSVADPTEQAWWRFSPTNRTVAATPTPTATPTPAPTPTPVRSEFQLMAGTRYATPVVVSNSGVPGPVIMVLGGVHGNEPAGWIAAEAIAGWEVAAGTLIVAPRVNHLAAASNVRTFDELGDLNRLYPGDPGGRPMARMAHEIRELVEHYGPAYLFDLHESWTFYPEAIGQTVAAGGAGEGIPPVRLIVDEVNRDLTRREQLSFHDRRGRSSAWSGNVNSSIALGLFVPDLTPVLVETAMQGQTKERRAEMHRMVVRAALDHFEML